jgi:hypothetical protein
LGFSVVKQWIEDILFSLNPSREELQTWFVTNLLKATNIGFYLDPHFVHDCLRRIPSVRHAYHELHEATRLFRHQIHPGLILRRQGGFPFYVLRGLLDFLGEGPGINLKHGILFFQYVVATFAI